jgi:hypothetical protein
MSEAAVFKGGIVAMKNVGYDASIHLTVALPQELGAAVIAAFGWPTTRSPIPVAIARLEDAAAQPKGQKEDELPDVNDGEDYANRGRLPGQRRFNDLSPAEQAGIICKEEEFREFLRTTVPYKAVASFSKGWQPEDLVRDACGVTSRTYIREDNEAGRQWRIILERYRRWLDERERAEANV